MNLFFIKYFLQIIIVYLKVIESYDTVRYSPFSTYFNNPYDYADAESYSTSLFTSLYQHMNAIKREGVQNCRVIPVPKTVLNKKYFNPEYEFLQYKYWYPPKEHQYVLLWAQYESYRNALFLSYMLQDDNARFPPGWLYLYLSTAAQLHSLQSIGYNSHKSIKGIKIPFESKEVFKINWWSNGNFQKFEKPFALYAAQPRPNDLKFVRVVDFGTGNYSNDYTGHGFIGSYIYDRQQFILNNSYEVSKLWRRPFQTVNNMQQPPNDPQNLQQQQQLNQQYNSQYVGPPPPSSPTQFQPPPSPTVNYQPFVQPKQPFLQQLPIQYQNQGIQQYQNDKIVDPIDQLNSQNSQQSQYYSQQQSYDQKFLPIFNQKPVQSLDEYSPFVYVNKNNIPITNWDPLIDNDRNNLNRVPDRNSPIGFDKWYTNNLGQYSNMETLKYSLENPFIFPRLKHIDTYRYAKTWWLNDTYFTNKFQQEYVFRIKPEERFYKFTGPKFEQGTTWSQPYFWCVDPTNWMATVMHPIWATNDFEYRNKIFESNDHLRFVGLSEVVFNYEEMDVNQCPGDRQLSAFASTTLCDSSTECLPLSMFGLQPGGYECQCAAGFYYPFGVQGPFKGKELAGDLHKYPLCSRSENLLQYPSWISKNAVEYPIPNLGTSSNEYNFNINMKRDVESIMKKYLKNKDDSGFLNLFNKDLYDFDQLFSVNKPKKKIKREINDYLLKLDLSNIKLPNENVKNETLETKINDSNLDSKNNTDILSGLDISNNNETLNRNKTDIQTANITIQKPKINETKLVLDEKIVNKKVELKQNNDSSINKKEKKNKRKKRFFDKRNPFEKLRDAIYGDQDILRRNCLSRPYQDVVFFNEDDERFVLNLKYHANQVFKPQMAQAVRIAHILSAYLQLHSPFSASSAQSQNDFSKKSNFGTLLTPDPQLEEFIVVGEMMSTLLSNYPIQEVNVFFNGTEFKRQKFFAMQNNLGFGLSAIRSDIEIILNRTNDDSHLSKSWYQNAFNRYQYGGGKTVHAGYYENDFERKFYESAGPYDVNSLSSQYRFDRYGIEMSLRKSFDGLQGNMDLPAKFYDAASSGIWFGPYYDCQKRYMKTKTTLRMMYSVPIITGSNKLPIGFVSTVVGSDLKWWKINPCDTSKERNMFQGIHRCDAETTMCGYQEVPDFENGYYLASYKCICKENYEFPFMDYGSGYFEGATMEKEYDKKVRGQPNIFDKLKCRPIMSRDTKSIRSSYWNSTNKISFDKSFMLILLILSFNYRFILNFLV